MTAPEPASGGFTQENGKKATLVLEFRGRVRSFFRAHRHDRHPASPSFHPLASFALPFDLGTGSRLSILSLSLRYGGRTALSARQQNDLLFTSWFRVTSDHTTLITRGRRKTLGLGHCPISLPLCLSSINPDHLLSLAVVSVETWTRPAKQEDSRNYIVTSPDRPQEPGVEWTSPKRSSTITRGEQRDRQDTTDLDLASPFDRRRYLPTSLVHRDTPSLHIIFALFTFFSGCRRQPLPDLDVPSKEQKR